jgi:hypothetical protein
MKNKSVKRKINFSSTFIFRIRCKNCGSFKKGSQYRVAEIAYFYDFDDPLIKMTKANHFKFKFYSNNNSNFREFVLKENCFRNFGSFSSIYHRIYKYAFYENGVFYPIDSMYRIFVKCDCCKKIVGVFVGDNKKNKPEYKNRVCRYFK